MDDCLHLIVALHTDIWSSHDVVSISIDLNIPTNSSTDCTHIYAPVSVLPIIYSLQASTAPLRTSTNFRYLRENIQKRFEYDDKDEDWKWVGTSWKQSFCFVFIFSVFVLDHRCNVGGFLCRVFIPCFYFTSKCSRCYELHFSFCFFRILLRFHFVWFFRFPFEMNRNMASILFLLSLMCVRVCVCRRRKVADTHVSSFVCLRLLLLLFLRDCI